MKKSTVNKLIIIPKSSEQSSKADLLSFENIDYKFNTTKGEVTIRIKDEFLNLNILNSSIIILILTFSYSKFSWKMINCDLFCFMFRYQIALDELKYNNSSITEDCQKAIGVLS